MFTSTENAKLLFNFIHVNALLFHSSYAHKHYMQLHTRRLFFHKQMYETACTGIGGEHNFRI